MPIIPKISVGVAALPTVQKRAKPVDLLPKVAEVAEKAAGLTAAVEQARREALRTRLREIENDYLDHLTRLLNDPDEGFLNQKGSPALQRAGDVSEELLASVDRYASLAPDELRDEFRERLRALGRGHRQAVMRHTYKQKVGVQMAQAAEALRTSMDAAINALDGLNEPEGGEAWLENRKRYEEAALEAAALRNGLTMEEFASLPEDDPVRRVVRDTAKDAMAQFHVAQFEALLRLGDVEAAKAYLSPLSKSEATKWLNEDQIRGLLAKVKDEEQTQDVIGLFGQLVTDDSLYEDHGKYRRFDTAAAKRRLLEAGVDSETYRRVSSMLDDHDQSIRQELKEQVGRYVNTVREKMLPPGAIRYVDPRSFHEFGEIKALDAVLGTNKASELLNSYQRSQQAAAKAVAERDDMSRRVMILAGLGSLSDPAGVAAEIVRALEVGDVTKAAQILKARGATDDDVSWLIPKIRSAMEAVNTPDTMAMVRGKLFPLVDQMVPGKRKREIVKAYIVQQIGSAPRDRRNDLAERFREMLVSEEEIPREVFGIEIPVLKKDVPRLLLEVENDPVWGRVLKGEAPAPTPSEAERLTPGDLERAEEVKRQIRGALDDEGRAVLQGMSREEFAELVKRITEAGGTPRQVLLEIQERAERGR